MCPVELEGHMLKVKVKRVIVDFKMFVKAENVHVVRGMTGCPSMYS